MLIEDISKEKRDEIGKCVTDMKLMQQTIRDLLFVVENKEVIAERFEGASDIFDVIKLWINGNSIEYIGESVFQSDGEPITKILTIFGIDVPCTGAGSKSLLTLRLAL